MAMLFESPDSQNQLNAGITMIQAAFASLTSCYNKELTFLNQELQMKTSKINDLEKTNKVLYNEKEQNELLIHKLRHENKRLTTFDHGIDEREHRDTRGSTMKANDYNKKTHEGENHCNDFRSLMNIPQSTKHSLKSNRSAANLNVKGSNRPSNTSIANIDELLAGFDETITKIKKYNHKNNSHNKGASHRPSHEIRKKLFKLPMHALNNADETDMWINNMNENSKDGHNGCHTQRENSKRVCNGNLNNKNDFFLKCRSVMSTKDYTQMMEIMRLTNLHLITKEETYERISYLMQKKYKNLLEEFDNLIFSNEMNE